MDFDIAKYIDHTILKPTTTGADIVKLCDEAIEYRFAAVCVPPHYVASAKKQLAGSDVKVATVIGFPFGYSDTGAKLMEMGTAIEAGADELDVVHNIAALKNGDWDYLENEAAALTGIAHAAGKVIKIIIETGELNDDEIIKCCKLYSLQMVDFIKTSTGYSNTGATVEAVQLIRANLPANIRIKASGGIRNFAFARQLIEAGAGRIGCSGSVAIVKESKEP